jgi:hypothetical protein
LNFLRQITSGHRTMHGRHIGARFHPYRILKFCWKTCVLQKRGAAFRVISLSSRRGLEVSNRFPRIDLAKRQGHHLPARA